ncbi:hypothetical protein IWT25_02182 [Secundilactobacillus pentosiphilus]|uniref:Uncharacterized protein n=1 Tax=Secundilactobacillus pentosiphilus TaxID=1714682 RepID=A0A1Z5IYG7_9LACO|nr:hypothetical protein [Secundilactobacillus pentosiphilus]GAX06835.1 hypothetical protein IWT25_02182 [Secundilactobacillus pentosiphilus]
MSNPEEDPGIVALDHYGNPLYQGDEVIEVDGEFFSVDDIRHGQLNSHGEIDDYWEEN